LGFIDDMIIKSALKRMQRMNVKESATFQPIIANARKQVQWTPKTFESYAKQGYKMNVYVYACVNQIARNFAGVPWYLYQKKTTKGGKTEEIETHPLLDLINKPNPFMGGTKFRENMIAYLQISGNSYIERVGGVNQPPTELYTLRPDRISIFPGDSQHMVDKYRYTIEDNKVDIDSAFIMHLLNFDPLSDWYGMSPMEAASRSVDQNNEAKKWNVEMLQNDCVAPGILETDKGLTDIQFDRLENNWREKYQLKGNKYMEGTPMILEGGLKWTSMGMSPKDMSWLEGSKLSAREIAIAYNVPPELIGDNSNKTYSNYKEARKALYEENILPLLDWYKDEINNWLVPLYGSDKLYLDYDLDDIEALQEDRDSIWKRVETATFLKQNEKRVAVGYDELTEEEGGEIVLVGTNVQDLKDMMKEDEPEPDPAAPVPPGFQKPIDPLVDPNVVAGNQPPPTEEEVAASKAYLRSVKSVTKKDAASKQIHFEQFNIRREPFIQNANVIISKHFDAERRAVVAIVGENGVETSKVFKLVEQNAKNWKKIIDGIYVTVADEFAKDTITALKAYSSGYEHKDIGIPDELLYDEVNIAKEETLKWLEANSAAKVKGITETTREALRSQLHEGVSKGESIVQLAARIDALYLTNFMKNRSTVIARTEVIGASNLGSRSAALGLKLPGTQKEWLSASDNRVRMWHQSANGQNRDLNDPYDVLGEKLMFPGDGSMGASAINLVQCRCCETYELPENI